MIIHDRALMIDHTRQGPNRAPTRLAVVLVALVALAMTCCLASAMASVRARARVYARFCVCCALDMPPLLAVLESKGFDGMAFIEKCKTTGFARCWPHAGALVALAPNWNFPAGPASCPRCDTINMQRDGHETCTMQRAACNVHQAMQPWGLERHASHAACLAFHVSRDTVQHVATQRNTLPAHVKTRCTRPCSLWAREVPRPPRRRPVRRPPARDGPRQNVRPLRVPLQRRSARQPRRRRRRRRRRRSGDAGSAASESHRRAGDREAARSTPDGTGYSGTLRSGK